MTQPNELAAQLRKLMEKARAPEAGQADLVCLGAFAATHGDLIIEALEQGEKMREALLEARAVISKLLMNARTSGGTAGPDQSLMEACEDGEMWLEKHSWRPDMTRAELAAPSTALADAEADGWERGMRDAANICGTLAETTYDDSDGFEAAVGCEAEIRADLRLHQRNREAAIRAIEPGGAE